jgi:hypothetical protein
LGKGCWATTAGTVEKLTSNARERERFIAQFPHAKEEVCGVSVTGQGVGGKGCDLGKRIEPPIYSWLRSLSSGDILGLLTARVSVFE